MIRKTDKEPGAFPQSRTILLLSTIILLIIHPVQTHPGVFHGLWQGPHPVLDHMTFIIHIQGMESGSLSANGYWADRNIITTEFPVDCVSVRGNRISMRMNQWNCAYSGKWVANQRLLEGCFECTGELPDSVSLQKISKNDVFGLFPDHLDDMGNFHYEYNVPQKETPGIAVASIDTMTISRNILSEMVDAMATGQYGKIHSFLLIKNNRLVSEHYFYGFRKDVLHPLESATKSITSLLTGILYDQGKLTGLNSTVTDFFRASAGINAADMSRIRIKHLLTMCSGVASDQQALLFSENRLHYLLRCRLAESPGRRFDYQNWNTEMLGALIKEISGYSADYFAGQFLFTPLQIKQYDWNIFKNNGYPLCGGALRLRPRDMARIGLLVLNKGLWRGRRVISEKWINESTNGQIETGRTGERYGYQWWISEIQSGQRKFQLIWANGLGSQFIFIFPELQMVMVTTGGNWNRGNDGRSWDIFKMLDEYLNSLIAGNQMN